jgi:hypothetical protein
LRGGAGEEIWFSDRKIPVDPWGGGGEGELGESLYLITLELGRRLLKKQPLLEPGSRVLIKGV